MLAVDARWIKTGIGRYTMVLLRALREELPEVKVLAITSPEHAEAIAPLCEEIRLTNTTIYTAREQLDLPRLAAGADAFFAPHYNAPVLWHRRLLLTIHDLTHRLYPDRRISWQRRCAAMALMRVAVRRAYSITCPSQYTKAMLLQHFAVAAAKIAVIPGCVGGPFRRIAKREARQALALRHGLTRPFALYVGNLAPHKDVPILLRALAKLQCASSPSPLLIIASNDERGMATLQSEIARLQIEQRVVWMPRTSDPQLAELYAGARMTIMPSREEGFGLPVLESMACGTPVICSRAASLPEVGGDAALYFEPGCADELSSTMARLMDEPSLEQRLVQTGLARAQLFSPERVSAMHVSLIRAALGYPLAR